MKTMKKVLALVLALALTVSGIIIFANAEGLTTFEGSVLTYTLETNDADGYVKPGDSFTVTIKMQTNFYTGFDGKEFLLYTAGILDTVAKADVVAGTVAKNYTTTNVNVNVATNAIPAAYKTGYKAILMPRTLNTDFSTPYVYETPTDVFTITFRVPATAEVGSTVTFIMPSEVVGSATVTGRNAMINQYVINNDSSALSANDVAKNYTETVNLPDPLVITIGEPAPTVDKSALQTAIETLPTVGQDEATSASWTAYADALATAQDVYADADATQDEVDAAALALTNATNGVTRLGNCDYTALDAAITAYEALTLDDYTPASVTDSDVAAKYDAAKAVTRDMLADEAGANQGVIDAAATALSNAIDALVEKADKSLLETAITNAQGKNEADYTPASWTEADLASLLTNAQTVYNDANAAQTDVDAQAAALNDAMGKLVLKADKTALNAAIGTAPAVAEAEATSASWGAYQDALSAAQTVAADDNASQTAVDAATETLQDAIAGVTRLAACDYTALDAAIADYEELNLNDYTPNSVAASDVAAKYDAAKAVARDMLADEAGANQNAIDTAAQALADAIDALVEKVNKDALNRAIADAQSKNEADYTPASWTEADLANVIAAAQVVAADDNATADEVSAQITALETAVGKLVAKADKAALAAAIAAAQSKNEADYTPNSWAEADLANVISAAQVVYDDGNATDEQVSGAITALTEAVAKLAAKADKTALNQAIATLPTVAEEAATSASWAAYQDALSAAQGVAADDNASQANVDTATNNLLAAIDGVTGLPACDYTELNAQIAAYEALDFTAYTPNSVTASDVTAKYAAAGEVEADMLADEAGENQAIIDAAATALKNAIDALVLKGDKTNLIAEIAAAPAMDEDTATEDSWAAYQAELVDAQAVVDDENADQKAVDDELAALVAAKALVARDLCNYEALDTALALVPAKEESEYTASTWAAYADAKAEAEAVARDLVNNKAGTNQKLIDDAAAKLTAAYNRLRTNGCSITSFTCLQEHYMKNDVVTFAFHTKDKGYAKIQVVHDGETMTYDRDNPAVEDITDNGDGTETWHINIKIYSDEINYSARAKVFNAEGGWDTDYIDYIGQTSTGDDAEVKSTCAIVNGEEVTAFTTNDSVTLRIVAGKDTRRVRFTDTTRNLTMTLSTPKSVNEDGTKVFEVTRKLGEARDYTYAIDTADSTNKWTRSDVTLNVSVSKYVAPQVVPSTGSMDDVVISVSASDRVLRFAPQTFTVVTDKNASGFRLVDKAGNAIATQKADGVTDGDQTTWTLTKYYSATGTFTYKVQALYGKTWLDSDKTVTFTVAY